MSVGILDPAAMVERALEYATKNLRIERLLIQIGLDPATSPMRRYSIACWTSRLPTSRSRTCLPDWRDIPDPDVRGSHHRADARP